MALQKVVNSEAPTGVLELTALQDVLGIELPRDYCEFLLRNNGGSPVPAAFPIFGLEGNPEGVVDIFFSVNSPSKTEDLQHVLEEVQHLIPHGIVPIASTEGDDFICLDLRKSSSPVTFWDRRPFWGSNIWHEKDLYSVTRNFKTFIESLHEFTEPILRLGS